MMTFEMVRQQSQKASVFYPKNKCITMQKRYENNRFAIAI